MITKNTVNANVTSNDLEPPQDVGRSLDKNALKMKEVFTPPMGAER